MSPLRRRMESEDGAIAIMAAVLALALVAAAALAVDVGRVANASRDQQGATDRGALDSVEVVAVDEATDPMQLVKDVHAAAEASLDRNPEAGGVEERELYRVDLGLADGDGATDFTMACGDYFRADGTHTLDRGDLVADGILHESDDDTSAERQAAPTPCDSTSVGEDDPIDAVRLWTFERVGYVLALGDRESTLHKASVASLEEIATISIRSGLARVDVGESDLHEELFEQLVYQFLGGEDPSDLPSLTVAQWDGLADVDVPLGEFGDANGQLASRDEFVTTEVSITEVLDVAIAALSNEDSDYSAEISALDELRTIAVNGSGDATFALGELFLVTTENAAAITESRLAVEDLVMGSLLVANAPADGDKDVNVVSLDLGTHEDALLGLTGLLQATANVSLIEGPQYAVGPARRDGDGWLTRAETAQFDLELTITVDEEEAETLLGGLTSLVDDILCLIACAPETADLVLAVSAAEAKADLTDVACAEDPDGASQITTEVTSDAVDITVVEEGDDLEEGETTSYLPEVGGEDSAEELTLDVPGSASTGDEEVLADGLLLDDLVGPLFELLGIDLGYAEVRGHDVDCEHRRLLPLYND